MRITGGTLKGRLLVSPKKSGVRPTTDRLRSAVFSILSDSITDTYVLDLFAGTGSFGIESLSRGAKYAVFVDKDSIVVKENVKNLSLQDVKVLTGDIFSVLKRISVKFDIVFIDPPYGKYPPSVVLKSLKHLCNKSTKIIYEESKETFFTDIETVFKETDSRIYSDTTIKIYEVIS